MPGCELDAGNANLTNGHSKQNGEGRRGRAEMRRTEPGRLAQLRGKARAPNPESELHEHKVANSPARPCDPGMHGAGTRHK